MNYIDSGLDNLTESVYILPSGILEEHLTW